MKGHIRKRGDKYYYVLDLGKDKDGKRKQKWIPGYTDRVKTEKEMQDVINRINQGKYIEPSKEKFEKYIYNWLERKKKNITDVTYDTYKNYIDRYIVPGLGHYRLDKIQEETIDDFYSEMKKKYADWTVVKIHRILKAAFTRAENKGYLAVNPLKLVDPPSLTKKEIEVWDEKEAALFLKLAKDVSRYYIAFLLALSTGMRKGEILALKWTDIDLKNKTISVNRSLSQKNELKSVPKTSSSRRSIAINDQVIKALQQHWKKIYRERSTLGKKYQEEGLVVCNGLGGITLHRNLSRAFESTIEHINKPDDINIKRITFHSLRHTHATLLLKSGVHPKVVSERLGHSSIQVTIDTYSHILPGLQEAAAQQIEKTLFDGNDLPSFEELG